MGRRKNPGIATRCPACKTDVWHTRVNGEWQLRITYMPDETSWLYWPCCNCDEWQTTKIGPTSIARLFELGVRIDDLSLVDPGLERNTMPPVGPAMDDHIRWLGVEASSATAQGVMLAAVLKILAINEHPADGS